MLQNPALRAKLTSIDGSRQRMTDVWDALQEDDFYEFYTQVLEVMQIQEE